MLRPGYRYNMLTVMSAVTGRDSNGERKYLCHCDCGNDTIVRGYNITSGNTKSCGCWHAIRPRGKQMGTGYEVGMGRNGPRRVSSEQFREQDYHTHYLATLAEKEHRYKSRPGMRCLRSLESRPTDYDENPFVYYKREDLSGRIYGLLTADFRVLNAEDGTHQYRCQCQCGNTIMVRADDLKEKRVKDCGRCDTFNALLLED